VLNDYQSQAIKTPTAVYCSGQIPLTAEGTLIEGTIPEKTRLCCQNLEAVLKEAGSSIQKVVKVTIFLSDMGHFAVSCPPSPVLYRILTRGSPGHEL
jgi:enamine deaminase RidA (YjgF/YER057c/UK114 family)